MKKFIYSIMILLAVQCREKYEIPFEVPVTGYLVVDGIINSGEGETNIRLSRTTILSDRRIVNESGAIVQVEGEDNSVFSLIEKDSGQYSINSLPLNNNLKYRLRIRTKDAKEYASVFLEVNDTPVIDSISWQRNNGVEIFVHAHDPSNNTRYYKWDYEETWEFESTFLTNLVFELISQPGDYRVELKYFDPVRFGTNDSIFRCWRTRSSSRINIASTTKLTEDVLYAPILSYPEDSWELNDLYSLNLKLYSLSSDAYGYFERMKKNSELLGSIFDAQPSQLKGNMQCLSDPGEIVIGYMQASAINTKRIFISREQLPGWYFDEGCMPPLVLKNHRDTLIKAHGEGLVPIDPKELGANGYIVTFNAAKLRCTDCTLRGINKKPSFWP